MRTLESKFHSEDGAEIFYRAWLPEELTDKALILFHRGHEHSARWAETVAALKLDDVAVFAWDQRGHGKSWGERGHAEHMGQLVRDADLFVKHVCNEHFMPIEKMVVMAHSVGAVVATAWVHDFAPPIRGLILATPAFRVKLYVPLAVPALRLKQKFLGGSIVKSYVKSGVLTHDPGQASAYDSDPDIFREIAVNVLLDLHDTGSRLMDDAGAITTPTLILAAGNDWVVQLGAQKRFFSRLGSAVKQLEFFPGFYHAIFHELNRHLVIDKAKAFMLDCWSRVHDRPGLVDADKGGHTRTEYDLVVSDERTPSFFVG